MNKVRSDRRSLNRQMHDRMQDMRCFGESRDVAKKEYKELTGANTNRTIGIHSYNTYEAYKSVSRAFVTYVKDNFDDIKKLDDIEEVHIKSYVEHRAEQGYSPHTYSRDLAGLNKLFNTELTKEDCNVANRRYENITNNRDLKEHHNHINLDNYRDVTMFIEACGVRRSSLEKIDSNSFKYDQYGTPTHVCVTEKGGRYREAEIRESYRDYISEQIEKAGENKLFEHIPNRLPCHRFRQEYATKLYEEKLEKVENTEDRDKKISIWLIFTNTNLYGRLFLKKSIYFIWKIILTSTTD